MRELSFIFSNPSTLQPPYHCSCPCKLSCLQASTFIFCNPSTLQPRSHCSSPYKLSWSKPQQTLLSVDLRLLTCFPSASLCVQHAFQLSCVSFLQFPHFATFSSIFLHFPPCPTSCLSFIFLLFFPTFFLPFSRGLGGIEPYRHHIA